MDSPLTERDHELLGMPTIASQLPVRFPNKNVWAEVVGACKGCGCDIDPSLFRGQVTRPFQNIAIVEAVGVCHACRLLTRFFYRLHDDMRVTGQRGGKWVEWRAKPTLVKRLLGWFTRS